MDEDLDLIGKSAKMRDEALKWVARTIQEAKDKAGPQAKAEERATFYMIVAADLAAQMYIDLRKDFGDRQGAQEGVQVAQTMLKTTFTLVGSLLRRHGEEVQLRVGVHFTKSHNVRASKPEEDSKASCDHPCTCELDMDGNCAVCAEKIRGSFSAMAQAVRIMKQAGMENLEICFKCLPRHLDSVLARIIREELSKETPTMAEGLMNAMFLASQNLQTMPMPLTRKAWSETQKEFR